MYSKSYTKKSSSPPLDLLTVAALLPREWAKRLVDLNVTKLTGKDLEWADCVFIGAMAVQRESHARSLINAKKQVSGLSLEDHSSWASVNNLVGLIISC